MAIRKIEAKELDDLMGRWKDMNNLLKKYNVGETAIIQFFVDKIDNKVKPLVWFCQPYNSLINFLYRGKAIDESIDTLTFSPWMYIVPNNPQIKNSLMMGVNNSLMTLLDPVVIYTVSRVKDIIDEKQISYIEIDEEKKEIKFLTQLGYDVGASFIDTIFYLNPDSEPKQLILSRIANAFSNKDFLAIVDDIANSRYVHLVNKKETFEKMKEERIIEIDDLKVYPDMMKQTPSELRVYKRKYLDNFQKENYMGCLELIYPKHIAYVLFAEIVEKKNG